MSVARADAPGLAAEKSGSSPADAAQSESSCGDSEHDGSEKTGASAGAAVDTTATIDLVDLLGSNPARLSTAGCPTAARSLRGAVSARGPPR